MMPAAVRTAVPGPDAAGHPGTPGQLSAGRNPAAGVTCVMSIIRTHVRPAGEVESVIEHQFELLSTVPAYSDKSRERVRFRARPPTCDRRHGSTSSRAGGAGLWLHLARAGQST